MQTHWNGMYYMLQSLTEQQRALGKSVSEYEMSENLMHTSDSSWKDSICPYPVWGVNPLQYFDIRCDSCCECAFDTFDQRNTWEQQHQNKEGTLSCSCEEEIVWQRGGHTPLHCKLCLSQGIVKVCLCLFVWELRSHLTCSATIICCLILKSTRYVASPNWIQHQQAKKHTVLHN